MLRSVMLFFSGVFAGWTFDACLGHDVFLAAVCVSGTVLCAITVVFARPKKMPEQRLERHLMGLRVVGREGER
jgi:translation initiation factor 2 gamma subunit (eIF-2gamma)